MLVMDIAACAVTSLLGRFAWASLEATLSRSLPLPSLKPVSVFFIFFSIQYSLVKAYRYLIYPYFRSTLRKLPGPRVCPSLLSSLRLLVLNRLPPFSFPHVHSPLW